MDMRNRPCASKAKRGEQTGEQTGKVVDCAQLFPRFPMGAAVPPSLELLSHVTRCPLQKRELFPHRQA